MRTGMIAIVLFPQALTPPYEDHESPRLRQGHAIAKQGHALRIPPADAIRLGRNFPPEQIVIADASGHEVATISLKDVLPIYLLD